MNEINNSKKLYSKAKKYIAGGISSQIRVLEHSEVPLFISNAKGSKIWDVDGTCCVNVVARVYLPCMFPPSEEASFCFDCIRGNHDGDFSSILYPF